MAAEIEAEARAWRISKSDLVRECLQQRKRAGSTGLESIAADACLVRMTEKLPNPLVLTADSDFRVYRRHGRQVIPCVMPE